MKHYSPFPAAFGGLGLTRNPMESYNVRLNSLIAQLVERRTVNPQVPGSSPGRGAKLHAARSDAGRFFLLRNSSLAPQNVGNSDSSWVRLNWWGSVKPGPRVWPWVVEEMRAKLRDGMLAYWE